MCERTSEPGTDEVFYTYQIDGGDEVRYPPNGYQQMNDGFTWAVQQPYTFSNSLVITLWDDDNWPSTDDYLGKATYTPTDIPPVTDVSGSSGIYQIKVTKTAT